MGTGRGDGLAAAGEFHKQQLRASFFFFFFFQFFLFKPAAPSKHLSFQTVQFSNQIGD